jgi:hypothetical protein
MNAASEFIIEAGRPSETRGRAKRPLRLKLEQLQPGQVLRWRPVEVKGCTFGSVHSACGAIRKQHAERSFKVRKEHGGFDIFRIA